MNAILLTVILVIVFFGCLLLSGNEFLSPSVIFCASMLFCCLWAAVYAGNWNFKMGYTTIYTVAGGVIEFSLVAYMVEGVMRYYGKRFVIPEDFELKTIELGKPLAVTIIVFEMFSLVYTVYEILWAAETNDLSKALVYFNNTTKFTTDTVVFRHSGFLHLLWDILDALGFWITYPISSKGLLKRRPYTEITIFILSVLSNFLRGARTTAVYKVLALICMYFLLSRKVNKRKITAKNVFYVFVALLIFVAFLFSFKSIGTLMGRTITQSGMDYVALYCGSEVANLDAFLKEGWSGIDSIFDSQTLYALFYYIRPMFGMTEKVLQVLPVRTLGGVTLSNVYTTFYQYIYDYGFVGEFFFVGIMAIVSQIAYEYARSTVIVDRVPISMLVYAFIFTTLALSFFSNKFYERVVTPPFIYNVVIWFALNWLVSQVNTGKARERRHSLRLNRR